MHFRPRQRKKKISNFHCLEALKACLKAWPDVFLLYFPSSCDTSLAVNNAITSPSSLTLLKGMSVTSRSLLFGVFSACCLFSCKRPDGSVGVALVLPALTDCRWWFESLLVHSEVSSATRRKATGADPKKKLLSFFLQHLESEPK